MTRTSPAPSRRRSRRSSSALDQALEPALPAFLALLDVPVEDSAWEMLSSAGAAAAHHRRPEAAPPAGEPGPAPPGRRRGPPLDRRGDAGRARPPGREPAGGPAPAPRQLPPGVPARLEREDLLPPAPARPSPAGAGGRAPGNAPRRRRRPRAAQAAPARAERGQPLLPRGVRAEPRGRWGAVGRPRRPSAREGSRCHRRAGNGAGDPGGTHRPPAARRTGTFSRRPRSSARRFRSRCSRRSPAEPRTRWPMGSPACRPPSSSTRRAWSRTRRTPSSTPSPTRWPTTACSTSDDAPSTPGSWKRSKRLYPDRLAEHVERLAHHAVQGEAWEKAVAYLRQAGAKAFGHSANREAAAHFEQALEALERLPESRARSEREIDARLQLRGAAHGARRVPTATRSSPPRPGSRGDPWRPAAPGAGLELRESMPQMGRRPGAGARAGPAERRDGRSLGDRELQAHGDHVPGRDPQCAGGIPAGD